MKKLFTSRLKKTVALKSTLLLLLLFTNCRKDNLSEDVNLNKTQIIEDFFKLPATADNEIKALVINLKKQDSIFNFLPKFVAKNGIPVWDKVKYDVSDNNNEIIYYSTKNEDSNSKGIFLVPFVDEKTNQVKSYLVAKKYGVDKYAYQLYNKEELKKTKVSKDLERNLIQTQAVFGFFEKTINNKNEIELTNPKKTKIKDIDIKFSRESNKDKKVTSNIGINNRTCYDVFVLVQISYIDYTDGTSIEVLEYLYVGSFCEGSGGGGGDGGGGGGIPPGIDSPYWSGNWWDYGAGYPNPYDPNSPNYYYPPGFFNDPGNPYDPFYPWFGGGGGGGTPTTGYQLTQEDYQILNEIEAEDLEADNNTNTPCYGTGRSGNVKWPGVYPHWVIQFDYVKNNLNAKREYSIPGSSINSNTGYADIVNLVTNEIFEIKPQSQVANGIAEVNTYVIKANENCNTLNGGLWQKGFNYPTKIFNNPFNPDFPIKAELFDLGLILYTYVDIQNNPITSPAFLPQNLADKVKNFVRELARNPIDIEEKIIVFLRENRSSTSSLDLPTILRTTAAVIVIGTIVEDIVTGGVGIADDWASFVIARNMIRIASKLP